MNIPRPVRVLALLALFASAPAALAQSAEAEVKKAVEAMLGKDAKVEGVRDIGILGLYEVRIDGDILYTDRKASHLLLGDIIEGKSRKNLTEERKNKLSQIKWSDLPLELASKIVRGNGKRVIATFEDPNCGYCRKLAKELQGVSDITIYTFVYPVLGPDSEQKSKALWCSQDRTRAWTDWMLAGVAPSASTNCDLSGHEKVKALGKRLNVRGTPAIFFADGSRIPGYIPAAQVEQAIAKAGS